MSWHVSTYSLPRIHSFDAAAVHWADQKPWRNQHASWRELDGRRAFHKHVVKLADGEGYQMVLYQTPLVTYYANGNLSLQTYDSSSTTSFAWAIRPTGFTVETVQGVMYWGVPTADGMKYVRPEHTALHLVLVSPGVYQINSPVAQDTTWKLDLKKAAAVRKKLSHYDRWQKITAKLIGGIRASRDWRYGFTAPTFKAILADPENPEHYEQMYCRPVTNFLRDAYELEGARYKVPVPMGELPKRQR